MFKDAIKEVAYECKEWDQVDNEDRMYLYSEFAQTKDGIDYVMEALSGEGDLTDTKAFYTLLMKLANKNDLETYEDLNSVLFDLLDNYLSETIEGYFDVALAEVELDMEISLADDLIDLDYDLGV
jgi:hypothetical protein